MAVVVYTFFLLGALSNQKSYKMNELGFDSMGLLIVAAFFFRVFCPLIPLVDKAHTEFVAGLSEREEGLIREG